MRALTRLSSAHRARRVESYGARNGRRIAIEGGSCRVRETAAPEIQVATDGRGAELDQSVCREPAARHDVAADRGRLAGQGGPACCPEVRLAAYEGAAYPGTIEPDATVGSQTRVQEDIPVNGCRRANQCVLLLRAPEARATALQTSADLHAEEFDDALAHEAPVEEHRAGDLRAIAPDAKDAASVQIQNAQGRVLDLQPAVDAAADEREPSHARPAAQIDRAHDKRVPKLDTGFVHRRGFVATEGQEAQKGRADTRAQREGQGSCAAVGRGTGARQLADSFARRRFFPTFGNRFARLATRAGVEQSHLRHEKTAGCVLVQEIPQPAAARLASRTLAAPGARLQVGEPRRHRRGIAGRSGSPLLALRAHRPARLRIRLQHRSRRGLENRHRSGQSRSPPDNWLGRSLAPCPCAARPIRAPGNGRGAAGARRGE